MGHLYRTKSVESQTTLNLKDRHLGYILQQNGRDQQWLDSGEQLTTNMSYACWFCVPLYCGREKAISLFIGFIQYSVIPSLQTDREMNRSWLINYLHEGSYSSQQMHTQHKQVRHTELNAYRIHPIILNISAIFFSSHGQRFLKVPINSLQPLSQSFI